MREQWRTTHIGHWKTDYPISYSAIGSAEQNIQYERMCNENTHQTGKKTFLNYRLASLRVSTIPLSVIRTTAFSPLVSISRSLFFGSTRWTHRDSELQEPKLCTCVYKRFSLLKIFPTNSRSQSNSVCIR